MSWSIDLSPTWPFLSQLSNITQDGEIPVNTREDCGPTALAMIIQWLTGVCLDPDEIKDVVLRGENATGGTTPYQLRSFLSTYGGVPNTRLWPQGTTGPGSLTNLIWQYLVAGKPLIALKRYSDNDTFLHWIAVIGLDPSTVWWADPWTGNKQSAGYADFGALYAGALIGVDRGRDSFLSP